MVATLLMFWNLDDPSLRQATNSLSLSIISPPSSNDPSGPPLRHDHPPVRALTSQLTDTGDEKSPEQPATSPASEASLSEATAAFISARKQLAQGHQKLMRQLSEASPEDKHQAIEQWREENAEALATQHQLAIQMGRESRAPKFSVPSKPHIPEDATPELREFLTARHKVHENVGASIRKNGTREPNETTYFK